MYPSSLSYTPTTNGDHIWWYASIPADSNNASATSVCGPGMPMTTVTAAPAHPSLSMSPPATASKGVLISPAAIQAPLSGSSGAVTGGITFYVIASASAPTSCPSGFTQVGTASPNGDGSWTPAAGYTPSSTTTLWWYATFAGDANDIATQSACGAGMPSTTVGLPAPNLTIAGPASGASNVLIPASSITVTLAGSAGGTTAPIKVYVYGPSVSPPSTCTGAGWTQVGTNITPAGNNAYHPSAGYTPSLGGTYYWYATYAGDASNGPTNTTCGGGAMAATVVSGPNSFVFDPVGGQTAGSPFGVQITATLGRWRPTRRSPGAKCLTFSGPTNSPSGKPSPIPPREAAPQARAASRSQSGVATIGNNIKLYNAAATTLTATQGAITGSASFTVHAGAALGLDSRTAQRAVRRRRILCRVDHVGKNPGFATLHVA